MIEPSSLPVSPYERFSPVIDTSEGLSMFRQDSGKKFFIGLELPPNVGLALEIAVERYRGLGSQ